MTEPEHIDSEQLQAYLDQELGSDEAKAVELHLAECALCERELARLRALFRKIESLPVVDLDRDLGPRVLDAIRSTQAPSVTMRMIPLLQAALAAILLGLQWPVIRSGFLRLSATLDHWNIQAWLQQEAVSIQNVLAGIALRTRDWIEGLFTGLGSHVPAWPVSAWWLALAGVFSLWLLGNGFLLRNIERRKNRR
jgi:anti-sigma factor RsiW